MDAVSKGKRMRLISRVFSEVPEIARLAYQLFSGQHLQIPIRSRSLSWSNWNLQVLVFVEGGKAGNPAEKLLEQGESQQELNPHMTQAGVKPVQH